MGKTGDISNIVNTKMGREGNFSPGQNRGVPSKSTDFSKIYYLDCRDLGIKTLTISL